MDVDKLTLEDCMCSICMYIYVEPVTMPCTHTLCMPCFKQNVEATSLTCPLCRKRISSWARKAARDKTLVNKALWEKIQSMFPDKVEKRLDGEDDEDEETEINVHLPIINIARPGEIRKEYEEQLKRLEKERELERKREQEASEALIRQLEEEGKLKSVEQQLIEERDELLAKELENVVNEAGTDSPFNALLRESRNRLTKSRGSSASDSIESRSPATIESFIQKMRDAEKLKEADRASAKSPYPYKCFTPSDKDDYSRQSVITVSSTSSLSPNSYADMDIKEENTPNLKIQGKCQASNTEGSVPKKTVATTAVRSSSTQSSDSINQELNHFKPIRSCPLTPPRKLASGKVVEAPLIRTTPRNLNRSNSFSPTPSNSLSEINDGSPVMQRRWSFLDEERKSFVRQNSKSTETSNENKQDISMYFSKREKRTSPSENLPNEKVNTDIRLDKKLVIPLEPVFDEIKDFDDVMAPLMEINNIQKVRTETEKPLKNRQRKISKSENINNNSILSPQRSIKDWLSPVHNCKSMEIDSKEGILDLNTNQSAHTSRNKLKLKKYPKRKHTAYHFSDYVYPEISPKKKNIDCIELSSDEEEHCLEESGSERDEQSGSERDKSPIQMRTKNVQKKAKVVSRKRKRKAEIEKCKETGTQVKKLKSVKQPKKLDKHERVKTMHNYLQTKHSRDESKGRNRSDDNVFKRSSVAIVDKLSQEEADRRLALELEKLFKLEGNLPFSAIRIKGSDNEYNFRKKSKLSSS